MAKRSKPWYLRPGPIILLVLTLATTLATVPPLVASPTAVVLAPEGQSYAQGSGWYPAQSEAQEMELLGGLVTVHAQALRKDDAAGPAALYSWGSVKLPISGLVPRHVVEERLRDTAIDQLTLQGIEVTRLPTGAADYRLNGHDGRLTHYLGSTRGSDLLAKPIEVEIAVLTWRCDYLGSHGIAFGVGKIEPLETREDVIDFVHDAIDQFPSGAHDLDRLLDDAQEDLPEPDLEDPLSGEDLRSPYLDEIRSGLMAHTVCDR